MATSALTLINGQIQNTIQVSDRGLSYGDGLFETILVRHQQAIFLPEHLERLLAGCHRLGLNTDRLETGIVSDLNRLLSDVAYDLAVLKILVTRGTGKRGYFPEPDSIPTRVVSIAPYAFAQEKESSGIRVRWCDTPVSSNPALAGMKHLNRLENVLARAEWSDPDISEGLMLDIDGQVVEGTMSNVFFIDNGTLCTPDLGRSGVCGIVRAKIMDIAEREGILVKEGHFSKENVMHSDEVFVCNSLINMWPVVRIEMTCFPVGTITQKLQKLLKKEMLA